MTPQRQYVTGLCVMVSGGVVYAAMALWQRSWWLLHQNSPDWQVWAFVAMMMVPWAVGLFVATVGWDRMNERRP